MKLIHTILLLAVAIAPMSMGATPVQAIGGEPDSLALAEADSEVVTEAVADTVAPVRRKNFFGRFIDYFANANKEKKNKRFDMSFIGGPSYSNDASFSIGLMGSGLYRMNGCSPDMQPSNVAIYTNVSVIGMVSVGVMGNNFFPDDRYRINYDVKFSYYPSSYWGVGYDECSVDSNKTSMKRIMGKADAEFLFRLSDGLYVGPMMSLMILKAYGIDEARMALYHGQDLRLHNIGLGVTLQYDTRDNVTNPHRGVYVNVSQMFRPKFFSNKYAFSTTDVMVNAYQNVWRGGVLAEQVKGTFNIGNPSWEMMASLGGGYVMRGYYKGRYRDKSAVSAQVELRQHVYRRCGITLWGGVGSVFHDKESAKHLLPNYGVGFRWEFKKNVNVRLDLGFGRGGERGFVFNINEAF